MPRLLRAFTQWLVQTGDADAVAGLRDVAERALEDRVSIPMSQAAALLVFTRTCADAAGVEPEPEPAPESVPVPAPVLEPMGAGDLPGLPRSA